MTMCKKDDNIWPLRKALKCLLQNIVGNNAKGWMSKRVFQEKKARPIFRKTNVSYPLIRTSTCAYQEVRMFVFRKIWRALLSWNTVFEIRPFVLLPTIYTMLDSLFHKRNPFITAVISGSIFKKILRLKLEKKTLEEDISLLGYYND